MPALFSFLLACLAPYLNPQRWWFISFLGIGFPFLLLVVMAFMVWWLFIRRKFALISAVAMLIGFKSIIVFFAFHIPKKFEYKKQAGSIRIASWNVARFIEMKRNNNKGSQTRLQMMELIRQQDADIFCMQEFFHSNDSVWYPNLEYIRNHFNYPYYYYSHDNDGDNHFIGSIIFSRYPIIDSAMVRYPRPTLPEALMHADIKVNDDTIRVFTTHLQSLQFKKSDYEKIDRIKDAEGGMVSDSRSIFSKLRTGIAYRKIQADIIKQVLEDSPYPFLFCGDLNDVPNSYTYFTVRGDLQDAFLKKGFGIGRTFSALSPTLRIDYIFADKNFKIDQFNRVVKNYSDHYLLLSDVTLKEAIAFTGILLPPQAGEILFLRHIYMSDLKVYNTLTRTKEVFTPLTSGHVGMYVCGPTVYSDVHLGNCRTFISFDTIYRYLRYLGYKVRYVRNITDAGHLEGDRDEGDDKFSKKARLEQLEPMEIVQKYTVGFHKVMELFNTLPPTIEPTATGHITEQIRMTQQIIDNGYGYVVNGTVYFDVEKYNKEKPYGILTNRKLEDMLEGTRELDGQDEKRGRLDFALWIKAGPDHLMQWPSPWGNGFPGWHIECSAMSEKYLGKQFDIHGGGMDLAATHHTNEIAQSQACYHTAPVRYWLHTNMLTVNGVRMSKSAGNGFLPEELFSGSHPLLEKAYSPMNVRFFMLQTHYRSTLDFSNEALQAAEKGLKRLWEAYETLTGFVTGSTHPTPDSRIDAELDEKVKKLVNDFDEDMNDDFNTAKVLASMFELVPVINAMKDKTIAGSALSGETLVLLQTKFKSYLEDVFGLKSVNETDNAKLQAVMQLLIDIRKEAKNKKDFVTSDKIRNQLASIGILLKDEKGGSMSWSVE